MNIDDFNKTQPHPGWGGTGSPVWQEPYKPLPTFYLIPTPTIVNQPQKTKREIAIEQAIKFCECAPATKTADMLDIAEKIYQFLIK